MVLFQRAGDLIQLLLETVMTVPDTTVESTFD